MANEFSLIPGTLPVPYCFQDWQQTYNDFFSLGQVIAVNGSRFYNLGDAEPAPELRDFPWFRTLDGYWYFWETTVGAWVRPHAVPASGAERRIWVGNLTDLQTYDGGDVMAAGAASGPMWEKDSDFDARIPMGVGTTANGTAIALNTDAGADEVSLSATQLPSHRHYVGIEGDGIVDPDPETGYLRVGGGLEVDFVTGLNPPKGNVGQTRAAGETGTNLDPVPTIPPVRGCYFIKRTARLFYLPV